MTGFDHERVSRAIGAALAGPGGVGLVVRVFCGVPGVILTPARRGVFRSQPERIQIGDWRYELTADGRLGAAHVVNGIVLAEEVLAAGAVGPHIARALGQVAGSYGPTILPNIDAALEVLEAAPRF
ncbi:DUF5073 family protein [Mycobacterium sp. 663a-19]|uniref:DUF5073 family protein n=1 Tax=Mycobacterium sp. 663a-19 TaxID=2986148 RepID=UPI002D1E8C7C|nr:DUF5073 family protein [Mycobacterium sp. 663a-19]MEB3981730.1 DUF5073 family protein [Mycobacterium sp. 663a-19]